jgi:hypothetical protein
MTDDAEIDEEIEFTCLVGTNIRVYVERPIKAKSADHLEEKIRALTVDQAMEMLENCYIRDKDWQIDDPRINFLSAVDEYDEDFDLDIGVTDPPKKITILWGEAHEEGDEAKTYEFATQEELDAFLLGVGEMDGWMAWEEVEEGFVWHAETEEEDPVEENTTP